MDLLTPRDVDTLVDQRVARLHASTPRPARSGMLRARVGRTLITLGSALAGADDDATDALAIAIGCCYRAAAEPRVATA